MKTIGIVGGMGPHAGTALFNTILDSSDARLDQEYPSVILVSFPKKIADRTLYLTGKEKVNPAYAISEMIEKLHAGGATVIGIACNTAHSPKIYDVVVKELERKKIAVELVNMPMETYRFISTNFPHARRIGIMTTNGTYLSGVYRELLTRMGYEVVLPDPDFQDRVIHSMIYNPDFGLKASPTNIREEIHALADRAIRYFEWRHVDVIVLGCTELSLLFKEEIVRGIPVVDSVKSLARALVQQATMAEVQL